VQDASRIVVLGSELTTGTGDSKGAGWLGRVLARMPKQQRQFFVFPLSMVSENSGDMLQRWRSEAFTRFSVETRNYLVIQIGYQDVLDGISSSRARLNLASMLDEARREGIETLVIGPVPTLNDRLNEEIGRLNASYADVAGRRMVRYVDCFGPLVSHPGWRTELEQNGLGLPGQMGYGLVAWLILNQGWFEWLDVAVDGEERFN